MVKNSLFVTLVTSMEKYIEDFPAETLRGPVAELGMDGGKIYKVFQKIYIRIKIHSTVIFCKINATISLRIKHNDAI